MYNKDARTGQYSSGQAALAEDPDSGPSTHMRLHTTTLIPVPSSGIWSSGMRGHMHKHRHRATTLCMYTHM